SSFLSISFVCVSCDHQDLLSFPTRRSSDLLRSRRCPARTVRRRWSCRPPLVHRLRRQQRFVQQRGGGVGLVGPHVQREAQLADRSEEHTSELQSRENLVCRLLLEKKKQTII